MRLPGGRFDAQRHVMFPGLRRRRRRPPLQFTEWEIGRGKKTKTEERLKGSMKTTSYRSAGFTREIMPCLFWGVGGDLLVVY